MLNSKAIAEYLAQAMDDGSGEYRARKLGGKWCVWCDPSDHVVEFDRRTIMDAANAVFVDNLNALQTEWNRARGE